MSRQDVLEGQASDAGGARDVGDDVNAGDDSRLEAFLESHGKILLQYVNRLLPADVREWHDPLDVLQDVFLDAFCLASDFPFSDDGASVAWLKTVARRRIVDLTRQRQSLKRGGKGNEGQALRHRSVVALLEELAVYLRTPSKSAAAHEFRRALEDALADLPPDYAHVIRLRHIEGHSCKEAAQAMGRTEKALERLCARALEALRLTLGSVSSI
jgi:RNA polymerase sigma factor (sigma-70 family)